MRIRTIIGAVQSSPSHFLSLRHFHRYKRVAAASLGHTSTNDIALQISASLESTKFGLISFKCGLPFRVSGTRCKLFRQAILSSIARFLPALEWIPETAQTVPQKRKHKSPHRSGKNSGAGAPNRFPESLPAQKNRPPFSTGAKLPWFSRVARACLAARRRGGRRGGREPQGVAYAVVAYRSAPVIDATAWGAVSSWAAKLFSISRMCTLLWRTRSGVSLSGVVTFALPIAT